MDSHCVDWIPVTAGFELRRELNMKISVSVVFFSAAIVVTTVASSSDAASPDESPQALLLRFTESWDESQWMQKSGRRPNGYMLASDDAGWVVRMRTMQSLVAHGKAAVPVLIRALKSESVPERILAAQTLGYLAPDVPAQPLLQAAQSDPNPAVRLYAVDSLGMLGKTSVDVDWSSLRDNESNRDIRMHIGYAMERKQQPVETFVVEKIVAWDTAQTDTAEVGQSAPDFELTAATGETIRLSDHRGKQAVILIFIYGDT